MNAAEPAPTVRVRSAWRSVALPDEHGGWSLTAEAGLLGLLLAPSKPGVALALAGVVAFMARTPVKLVLVDGWRHRWLRRTRLATIVAAVELAFLGALAIFAGVDAGWSWLTVAAIAAPLVAVELWFDMRSRSRRLVPELCGAVGIAGVAAAVVIAGGESTALAVAAWLLLAARSIATIPFVRAQIRRLRAKPASLSAVVGAQLMGGLVAVAAVVADWRLLVGAVGVLVLILAHLWWTQRPPVAAKVLGLTELAMGSGLVAVAAVGARLG